MRHDCVGSGHDAQREAWSQACQDLAVADSELAAAKTRLQEVEARLERCSQRVNRLQNLLRSVTATAQRWWHLASHSTDALLAIGNAEASMDPAAQAEQVFQAAVRRAEQVAARVGALRQQVAQAHASRHAWGGVLVSASRLLEMVANLQDLNADERILDQRMAQTLAHADDCAGEHRRAQAALTRASPL